ncbi:hypothetical protein, partial [Burkholderia pseudomallei]|uniref:hypothetical protein n=1 Tax=Burkholderia pseudomallei TaxID=28450 RepID=UPI001E2D8524
SEKIESSAHLNIQLGGIKYERYFRNHRRVVHRKEKTRWLSIWRFCFSSMPGMQVASSMAATAGRLAPTDTAVQRFEPHLQFSRLRRRNSRSLP